MALASIFAQETGSKWADPTIITLIGTVGSVLIGAAATAAVKIIAALGTLNSQQRDLAASLLVVAKDSEAIKGHVNSEKTAAEGREKALKLEVDLLRDQLAEEKVTRKLLAQAAALIPALAVVPPVDPAISPSP